MEAEGFNEVWQVQPYKCIGGINVALRSNMNPHGTGLGSSPEEAADNLRLKDSVRESAEAVGTDAKEATGEK